MIQTITKSIDAKSIWISDTHLGSCGSQTEKLLTFLSNISCDTLFLNGDIFDKWLIKNMNSLENNFTHFFQKLNALSEKGVEIVFLPGNHDTNEKIKNVFKPFKVSNELLYTTINNKKYMVLHGDALDPSVSLRVGGLSLLGTKIYEFLLKFKKENTEKTHFSRKVKLFFKNLFARLFQYERKIIHYLESKKADGIICGHSHQPSIKKISSKDYLNSGDWIDNCTFLIENRKGEFELLRWGKH